MISGDQPTLGEVDEAVRDVEDVFIIVGAVLNSEPAALSPMFRDALASVVRLGRERAERARHDLEAVRRARR